MSIQKFLTQKLGPKGKPNAYARRNFLTWDEEFGVCLVCEILPVMVTQPGTNTMLLDFVQMPIGSLTDERGLMDILAQRREHVGEASGAKMAKRAEERRSKIKERNERENFLEFYDALPRKYY